MSKDKKEPVNILGLSLEEFEQVFKEAGEEIQKKTDEMRRRDKRAWSRVKDIVVD